KLDGNDGYQFIERAIWIRSLGVEYFVGLDGISVSLVLLAAVLAAVGAIAGFSVGRPNAAYATNYCTFVTAALGVFVALDACAFYVAWGLLLLSAFFLVGSFGGSRKEHAAMKLSHYGVLGSVLLLLAFVALYQGSEPAHLVDGTLAPHTFALPGLARAD